MRTLIVAVLVFVSTAFSASPVSAQGADLVRITPLGSHAGELCRNDRAILFEDPTGVRILYDPGRTVDEDDPRLGDVHVMSSPSAAWSSNSTATDDVRAAGNRLAFGRPVGTR